MSEEKYESLDITEFFPGQEDACRRFSEAIEDFLSRCRGRIPVQRSDGRVIGYLIPVRVSGSDLKL